MEAELEKKNQELEALQKSFDDYLDSSKDLETELEKSLADTEIRLQASETRRRAAEEKLRSIQEQWSNVGKQNEYLHHELAVLKEKVSQLEDSKRRMEIENEDLASQVRVLEANEETLTNKLNNALEDAILSKTELADLQMVIKDKESTMRDEIDDLKAKFEQKRHDSETLEATASTVDISLTIPVPVEHESIEISSTNHHKLSLHKDVSAPIAPSAPIKTIFDDESSIQKRLKYVVAHGDVDELREEMVSMTTKYEQLKASNVKLLYKVQAARGNIQVCCRSRPPQDQELVNGGKVIVDATDESELLCFDWKSEYWKSFTFDRVWRPELNQADVFSDVEPLILSVLDGYNTCIMAYGQTGSGKTFTMEGQGQHFGINYRSLLKIFEVLESRKNLADASMQKANSNIDGTSRESKRRTQSKTNGSDTPQSVKKGSVGNHSHSNLMSANTIAAPSPSMIDKAADGSEALHELSATHLEMEDEEGVDRFHYTVEMSMMEIYNEQVFDLLGEASGGQSEGSALDIRQAPDGTISVPGLKQTEVHGLDEVMAVFHKGSRNRATASTNLNEHSSRSHLIVQVDVTVNAPGEGTLKGKLCLVDLAGSERVNKSGVTGIAMKEAQFINKSLLALGDVMEALDQKQKFVPYRNSKLTFLLQNSLGGGSKTMLVVTLCPTEANLDETLFTLQFATRVRNINLGAAVRYSNTKNLEVTAKNLRIEVKELKKKKALLEEALTEAKKEIKRAGEKSSAPLESKVKTMEEGKRAAELLAQQLTKQLQDVTNKVNEERSHSEKLTEEIDLIQKNFKKALDQIKELKVENDRVSTMLKSKERELESVQAALLRNVRSAGSSSDTSPMDRPLRHKADLSPTRPMRNGSDSKDKDKSRVSFTLEDLGELPPAYGSDRLSPMKKDKQPTVSGSNGRLAMKGIPSRIAAPLPARRESFPLEKGASKIARPSLGAVATIHGTSAPTRSSLSASENQTTSTVKKPSAHTSSIPSARLSASQPTPAVSSGHAMLRPSTSSTPNKRSLTPTTILKRTPVSTPVHESVRKSDTKPTRDGERSLTPTYVPFSSVGSATKKDGIIFREMPGSSSSLLAPTTLQPTSGRVAALNSRTEDALRRHQLRMGKKREQA